MFCSECGKPVQGKFCSHCGTALGAIAREPEPPIDLNTEVRYEMILKFPGVREKIDQSARNAKKRISGEQFLAMMDKMAPIAVFEGLAGIVQPLYASWGIKTGKQRENIVSAPVGQVIVRALCSLARNGQTLRGVTQAEDGCLIEATLPSDLLALEGKLTVAVHRAGDKSNVSGATHIGGAYFDWGKSTRCLNTLFEDLSREAA